MTNPNEVKYLIARKKSTKAKICKFEDCRNALISRNKSGYCSSHYKESPKGEIAINKAGLKYKQKYVSLNIDREIYNEYSMFCNQYGFNKAKKIGLIVKEFLEKIETKILTHKEFQKAVDKAGLRGHEFKEASEVEE